MNKSEDEKLNDSVPSIPGRNVGLVRGDDVVYPVNYNIYGPNGRELPKVGNMSLTDEQKAECDIAEKLDPAAVDKAVVSRCRTLHDVIKLVVSVLICFGVIYSFFPWHRFIHPSIKIMSAGLEPPEITLVDVNEVGGLERLSPPQRAVYEISVLRKKGELVAVKEKCESLLAINMNDSGKHEEWLPVWEHYLKILDELKMNDRLELESARLVTSLTPDAMVPKYYLARVYVESVPKQSPYDREKEAYMGKLNKAIRYCDLSITALHNQGRLKDDERYIRFKVLKAKAYRGLWWLSKCSWKDPNREKAFKELRDLDESNSLVRNLKLEMLRECKNQYRRWYRNDPPKRIIDGEEIDYKTLEGKIQNLEQMKSPKQSSDQERI